MAGKKTDFDGVYVTTKVLGQLSNGNNVELGHYHNNATNEDLREYIYITGTYTNKKGEEKSFTNATKLTLSDLADLQKIDLSGFDTEAKPDEMFD